MYLYNAQITIDSTATYDEKMLLSVNFTQAIRRMLFSNDTIENIMKWSTRVFNDTPNTHDAWPCIEVTRFSIDTDDLKRCIVSIIDGDYLLTHSTNFLGSTKFFFKINSIELYRTSYCTIISKLMAEQAAPSIKGVNDDVPMVIQHSILGKATVETKAN